MWVAVFNNLPELAMWLCFAGVTFYAGRRFERWRTPRR